ncbi:MAG TPA: spermidine/putrescine ABC transporter substrate-binding protein [Euzebyales bacterium]|nr:spermidine/putrescine ABC transporter substrate-binding protein [Euzebyales bacterium]
MTRRLTAFGAVLVLLLAACSGSQTSIEGQAGGGGGDAGASAAPGAATEAASGGPAADCEPDETDGELVLYNWTEYIDPELITQFRDEFGVEVIEDFYPNNEELLARVQSGSSGYDVIVPSDYMVGIMRESGLLLRLDRDAIPNADNIAEDFTAPPFDPELAYHMPYQWGTTGLAVDLEVTGEDPEPTWGWIFDPEMSADLGGRITMLDDAREAMGAALRYLGHSVNSTDEAQLQEAADLIAQATERLAAFDSDQYEDLLVGGETAVAHGYSGDFFAAFDAEDGWDDYAYLIPEEGAVRWVDTMAVLADAPHPCTAHTFINFILDAERGAQLTNWTFYASPNEAAREFIDAEILDDPAIYPPEDVTGNLEFLEDTGESERLYTDLFTEAKG